MSHKSWDKPKDPDSRTRREEDTRSRRDREGRSRRNSDSKSDYDRPKQ